MLSFMFKSTFIKGLTKCLLLVSSIPCTQKKNLLMKRVFGVVLGRGLRSVEKTLQPLQKMEGVKTKKMKRIQ